MTDLSPSAQAVLDAVRIVPMLLNDHQERVGIAAALRAAADQVGQVSADPGIGNSQWRNGFSDGVRLVYRELLAIAAELDPPTS